MKSSQNALRSLLGFFWREYRYALILGVLAIVVVDLAELILPILLKRIVDAAQTATLNPDLIRSTLYGVLGVVACQVICRYVWRMSLARGSLKAGADFRQMFSLQIFEVPFVFFDKRKVGELMTLATSDVENMRLALGPGLISLVDSCFYCITIPVAMFLLSPSIAVRILIPVIGIPVAVILLQKKIGALSRLVQDQIGKLGTQTQEMIAGVRLAKIYGVEERLESRLNERSHALNRHQVSLSKAQAFFGPALEFFLSGSLVLLFGAGASVSVGTLVAMQRYLQKLMWPMTAMGMSVVIFQRGKSSGEDFYRFIEEPRTENLKAPAESSEFKVDPSVPLIEARNLTYGAIQNLSFKVNIGEWVGIEGRVASGKSTFLSLLLKFYDVPRGQLFVNGTDINDWDPRQVRRFFSSVLQDLYLFRGSIHSNLNVGEEVDLERALEVAHVQGAVSERLQEELGEKGSGLSGGQKQRIAIARALRKGSPVLLLDDPLSSVDLQTSRIVLKNLVETSKDLKKTVIFVSHHPEHLAWCDRVVSMHGGET